MTSEVGSPRKRDDEAGPQLSAEQAAASAIVAEAKARGMELTGPNGLLKVFTENLLETALKRRTDRTSRAPETAGQPGPGVHESAQQMPVKTAISDAAGESVIDVPRDRKARSSHRS